MEIHIILESSIGPWLEGDLDRAIEYLKSLKKKYRKKFNRLTIVLDYEYSPYEREKYTKISLMGYREETEAEKKERLQKENEAIQNREKQERELLAKLQKKYQS